MKLHAIRYPTFSHGWAFQPYLEAGADSIFPEELLPHEMFEELARRMPGVNLPANMAEFGRTPFLDADECERMGYHRIVIWPVSSLRVANKAQAELYATLARDGSAETMLPPMQTRLDLYDVIGLHDYEALDASIMRTVLPNRIPGGLRD